jgi:hypothetical protein
MLKIAQPHSLGGIRIDVFHTDFFLLFFFFLGFDFLRLFLKEVKW